MKKIILFFSCLCLLLLFLECSSTPGEPAPTPEPVATTEPVDLSTPDPAPLKEPETDTSKITAAITALSDSISPNKDGFKETIAFKISAEESEKIKSWKVEIKHVITGKVVKDIAGTETPPESSVSWDGTGTLTKAIEGKYFAILTIEYEGADKPLVTESNEFMFDTTPPEISMNIKPLPFSPDGDNVNDNVTISFSIKDSSPVYKWEIIIFDETGKPFHSFSGGEESIKDIVWNGINGDGHIVEIAHDYKAVLSVTDMAVNTSKTEKKISVDVLVEKTADNRYRIKINSIIFKAYVSDFKAIEEEILKNNLLFFNQLHKLMKKYPQYIVLIEGHAMMPQDKLADKKVFDKYNKEVLIPLSKERAGEVRKALINLGIDGKRIKTDGIGASRPVVSHDDLENRWKNRRVEFYLVKD